MYTKFYRFASNYIYLYKEQFWVKKDHTNCSSVDENSAHQIHTTILQ